MIDQVRRAVGHAAAAAARAEAAPLAGKRYQSILAASGTPKPRKAGRETATRQEIAELPLDRARQAVPVAHRRGFCAERLEVVAYDLVQNAVFRPTLV